MKVCVGNVGTCARRNLDAMRVFEYFKINNHDLVTDPKIADYICLFTCGFTDYNVDACLKSIVKLNQNNGILVVLGCLPKIEPKELSKVFNGPCIPTKSLSDIDKLFPDNKTSFSEVKDQNIQYENYLYVSEKENLEALFYSKKVNKDFDGIIRVSDGCPNKCTYCSIKKSTGNLKSKSISLIEKELEELELNGMSRILIEGEDVGSYGIDVGKNIIDLLEVFEGKKIELQIKSLNPKWVVKYNREILDKLNNINLTKIFCPIQSGSQSILKSMARYSNVCEIKESFIKIKERYPSIKIITHLIVGFPGETLQDVNDTIEMCKDVRFDQVDIFKYSERESAPSYKLNGKITEDEIVSRMNIIKDNLTNIAKNITIDGKG